MKEESYYLLKKDEKRFNNIYHKLTKIVPDPSKSKEHYDSFLRKVRTLISNLSKTDANSVKAVEKPKTIDISIEQPKLLLNDQCL